MKRLIPVVLTLASASGFVMAQSPPTPELTKEHKELARDVGEWTAEMTMWMQGPDAEPMKMPATEKNTLMDGGMWLLSEFESGPFQGRGVFGYDPVKKQYVGSWVDNNTPQLGIMHGNMDDEGQLVMKSKGYNPMTQKEEETKSITKFKDDDNKLFTMMRKDGASGKWVKVFTIDYKRKK